MAYSDYDQGQIVAQVQAFFQLKRETDPGFLEGTRLSTIDGGLGGANSNTNQSIQAWLEQKGLDEEIKPGDPDYLEKVYNAVRVDLVSDAAITQRLQEMTVNPDTLSEEQREMLRAGNALHGYGGMVLIRDPAQEKAATAQAAMNVKDKLHTFSVQDMKDDDALTEQQQEAASHAMNFLKQNGLVTQTLQDQVGDEIDNADDYRAIQSAVRKNQDAIKSKAKAMSEDPSSATTADIYMMQAVMGMYDPSKYATTVDGSLGTPGWGSQTLSLLGEFASSDSGPATPAATSEQYKTYFMNNIVLTRGNFGQHTQRVWNKIQAEGLEPGAAIDAYVDDYVKNYNEEVRRHNAEVRDYNKAHPSAKYETREEMSIEDKNRMTEQIVEQMGQLLRIEAAIEGIRPTPELIADNFIETRVLPEVSEQSREAWKAMQEGKSQEEAIREQLGSSANPKLEQQMTRELNAMQAIRENIINYEKIEITPEDTLKQMQQSWANNPRLPNSIDHYSNILTEKIKAYEESGLDPQTASARAAVDVRAQIDRDSGVPSRAIVDESHSYYQSDVQKMGDWLRDRKFIAEYGGVTQDQAEAYGRGDRDYSNYSSLDFYTSMYGGGYRIHRRDNIDLAMKKAYDQAAAAIEREGFVQAPAQDASATPAAAIDNDADSATTRAAAEAQSDAQAAENDAQAAENDAQNAAPEVTPDQEDTVDLATAAAQSDAQAAENDLQGRPALNFGEDFHANNPFRMTVPTAELENADQITKQAVSMGNAIAFHNIDGKVTLEQAALAYHGIHDEDFARGLTDDEKAKLGTLTRELGVEDNHAFDANDPRLLQAIAAYANETTIAALPEEWKQAFEAISPQINVPDNKAAEAKLADEFSQQADNDADPATTRAAAEAQSVAQAIENDEQGAVPQATKPAADPEDTVDTATAAAQSVAQAAENDAQNPVPAETTSAEAAPIQIDASDAMKVFTDTNWSFVYDFTGVQLSYSIEDSQFQRDAYNKYDAMMATFDENKGDPADYLQSAKDLASFIRDGMEERQLEFVEKNWDTLKPYLEAASGQTFDEKDAAAGVQILREQHDAVVQATFSGRGAHARELLRDMNGFNKFEKPRTAFNEHIEKIDRVLAGEEPEAPKPETTADTDVSADAPTQPAQEESNEAWYNPKSWF